MNFLLATLTILVCSVVNSISHSQNGNPLLQLLEHLAASVEQAKKLRYESPTDLELKPIQDENTVYRMAASLCGVGLDADPLKQYDVSKKYFRNCYEIFKSGNVSSGIYVIKPDNTETPFEVLCDMELQGGGWTHIQKRVDGRTDFYRGWRDYRFGFGYLDEGREFWLGLENIHKLTGKPDVSDPGPLKGQVNELLVEIVNRKGEKGYALYKTFAIGREEDGYPLNTLSGYSGNAGDALTFHLGMKFSTFDLDMDKHTSNCAEMFKGAWWYKDCHMSNLNGKYINLDLPDAHSYKGLSWRTYGPDKSCHAKSRMLIRPGFF